MPKTLLLADDSVTIQKVVGISFANEDVKLVTVDNGDDAVAKARELRPDIILADVVMPGMSGYEVCEAVKADPALRHVPVLLLTGTFEAFDEARAHQVGADGHITKPFEAQALVDTVNARLAAAGAAPPAEPAGDIAPVEPARSGPEDAAYDFFEGDGEDAGQDGDTTVLVGDDFPAAAAAGPSFSFDAPDDVHQELTAPPSSRPTAPEPQPTLQQAGPLVEEPPAPASAPALFDDEPALDTDDEAPAETRVMGPDLHVDPAAGESFDDFLGASAEAGPPAAVDDDPLSSVGPDDLAGESILDPAGSRDYDVSSSDLGDPLASLGEPVTDLGEATPPLPTGPAGTPVPPDDDAVSLDELAPEEPEPIALEPESEMEPAVTADEDADPFGLEAGAGTAPAPEADPFEALTPREALAPEPLAEAGDEPAWPAPPERAHPAPPEATGVDAPGAPALSAAQGQQLHEMLERLAWEALGDVSERIVQDALDRIEKVAWEVIPQMAEALVREEIRKLKGEG
jgi:CheY-like chemotaxis protein